MTPSRTPGVLEVRLLGIVHSSMREVRLSGIVHSSMREMGGA